MNTQEHEPENTGYDIDDLDYDDYPDHIVSLIKEYAPFMKNELLSTEQLLLQFTERMIQDVTKNMHNYKERFDGGMLEAGLIWKLEQAVENLTEEEVENAYIVEEEQVVRQPLLIKNAASAEEAEKQDGGILIGAVRDCVTVNRTAYPASQWC